MVHCLVPIEFLHLYEQVTLCGDGLRWSVLDKWSGLSPLMEELLSLKSLSLVPFSK